MKYRRHSDPMQHMNDERHADDLLIVARAFAGHPDASAARVERVDPRGVDLVVATPNGPTTARVEFCEAIPETDYPDGVRVAFVRLARRARTQPSASEGDSAVP